MFRYLGFVNVLKVGRFSLGENQGVDRFSFQNITNDDTHDDTHDGSHGENGPKNLGRFFNFIF
jgi:hypothetical protein